MRLVLAKKKATKVWGFGAPSSALIGTTHTAGMGADAFTWADGRPVQADKYGNLIAIVEDGSNNHWYLWRNVGGAWTDGTHSWGSLIRGTMAYDAANNLLHVIWATTQANGGIVYRRYVVTYNGSNQITDINEDTGAMIGGVVQARTNVVLDDGSGISTYEHPTCLFLGDAAYGSLGAILASWSCNSGTAAEVRCSMLNFNGVGARGQTLGNWAAPITSSGTTLGANTAPAVAYTAVYANAAATMPYSTVARKAGGTHARDLYFFFANGAATQAYQVKRATWNSGASDWSTGLSAAITCSNVVRAGTNQATGYNTNRTQLITRPSESASGDCMFMAAMTWKDDANGDTWTLCKIDNADAITSTDVLSFAGGTNISFGPWGDVQYDNGKDQLVLVYTNTSNFVMLQSRKNDLSVVNAATQVWNTINGADVPMLVDGGSSGGTIWMLFRDTAVAHNGYVVQVAWT